MRLTSHFPQIMNVNLELLSQHVFYHNLALNIFVK